MKYASIKKEHLFLTTNDTIIFLNSSEKFNTINDLLKLPYFANKIVYIDLWATTCIPCIREFNFSNKLYEKYKDKNVVFLYLCENYHGNRNDEWRKKWKKLVTENNLKGIHLFTYVLPPDSLIHEEIGIDFLSKISDSKKAAAYGVPFYMIANKGKIILNNVSRPSDLNTSRLIDSLLVEK